MKRAFLLLAICVLGFFAAKALGGSSYTGAKIAVVNQSSFVSGKELAADLPAFQQLIDQYVTPAWNVQAHLYIRAPLPGDWVIYLRDDSPKDCSCYGYHDWKQDRPVGFIYTSVNGTGGWPRTFSHELEEMLADPSIDRVVATAGLNDSQQTDMWMQEVSDPVVDSQIRLGGLSMADFVLPAWFEPGHLVYKHKYDAAGALHAPLGFTANGYAYRFSGGKWGMWPPMPPISHRRMSFGAGMRLPGYLH